MARRSYDRMYKNYDEMEDVKIPSKEEKKEPVIKEEKVKEEKKVEEPVKQKPVIRGKVIGGLSLNVRRQPSTVGEIVSSLKDGDKIVIVDDSYADWYKISSPEGFVMRKYVQII